MNNLPKFKDFIIEQTLEAVFPLYEHLDASFIKLYRNDTSFELSPVARQQINTNQAAYMESFKKVYAFNDKNFQFTDQDLLNNDFAVKIMFSTLAFDIGLSFEGLQKISEKFSTNKIYVSGDGHDYELSEVTSDHSSEIILRFVPEKKQLLLERYNEWEEHKKEKIKHKNDTPKLK
jgi:hypothetical protein